MSKQKTLLLGENFSTATNRLRKMILFKLVQETNRDTCFRCGLKILNIDTLSIEHTESWQLADNPPEVFYNLSKIAFSHLVCNTTSTCRTYGSPVNKGVFSHGTAGYRYGCRCITCKQLYSQYRKDKYRRLKT